eukprot:GEMP01018717.1.p1 GENE.GEMP01018717.1~~GEMP01018717.1.p1  ORF type:complete len:365 (+),score=49.98 GEMP01018717.1:191-1285(+)
MGETASCFENPCEFCKPKPEQRPSHIPVVIKDIEEGCGEFTAFAVSSAQGWRMNMEDAHISMPDFTPEIGLFAVLDGHGGKGVARLAARILPVKLKAQRSFSSQPPNYAQALTQAFVDVDEYLHSIDGGLEAMKLDHAKSEDEYESIENELIMGRGDGAHPSDNMGCTCVTALVFRHKVIVANIGDSRCVLSGMSRSKGEDTVVCMPLSFDHKPADEGEEKRIVAAGGTIVRDLLGGYRINGGLNVSRCFADFSYKRGDRKPHECMISVIPEIQEYSFQNLDRVCVILCCDGIWERNSNDQVAQFIQSGLKSDDLGFKTCRTLSEIASDLIDRSTCTFEEKYSFEPQLRFTGQDNMTVLLVRVK